MMILMMMMTIMMTVGYDNEDDGDVYTPY